MPRAYLHYHFTLLGTVALADLTTPPWTHPMHLGHHEALAFEIFLRTDYHPILSYIDLNDI
jgi:hypothetical protein